MPFKNLNHVVAEKQTAAQKIADITTSAIGSWGFLLGQVLVYTGYIVWNILPGTPKFDGFPFIFLNLVVGFESAFAAPLVMMSQNRQEDRDRIAADIDHQVNVQSEHEVRNLIENIDILVQRIGELNDKLDVVQNHVEEARAQNRALQEKMESYHESITNKIAGASVQRRTKSS